MLIVTNNLVRVSNKDGLLHVLSVIGEQQEWVFQLRTVVLRLLSSSVPAHEPFSNWVARRNGIIRRMCLSDVSK